MTLDPALADRVRRWIGNDPDPVTAAELASLLATSDGAALAERFGSDLEFGTAGIRGLLGAGPSRMNRAVARRMAAGIARVLRSRLPDAAQRGVVVAHDMRRLSRELALEVCGTLTAAGLRVQLLDGEQPTPLLAFAALELHSAAAVMVTASHNPPQYNGIKVYWDQGVQIVPPIDAEISAAIAALGDAPIPCLPVAVARSRRLLSDAPPDMADRYLAAIGRQVPAAPTTPASPHIIYTPLHGVALPLAQRALANRGFADLSIVAAQAAADGSFPTVALPNPEESGALDLALAQGELERADLVLAHDPDGDRLAAAARADRGELQILTGDQIGSLLGWEILSRHAASPPRDAFVVTTVVSSSQLASIARLHGVHCEITLTGLKWIWTRALELERRGGTFLFGYEEALGYSVGPAVRDKDGISAGVLLAEMAREAAAKGETLFDRLAAIESATGVVATRPVTVPMTPREAQARVRRLAEQLIAGHPPLADLQVLQVDDYETGIRHDLASGAVATIELPATPLLVLKLAGGRQLRLRPSGTEPKLKIYLEAAEAPAPRVEIPAARQRAARQLDHLEQSLRGLLAPENEP